MFANLPLIDVNIMLGQWPVRRAPCDHLGKLIKKLRAHNVAEAWAGHYDGLFQNDLTDVNNRLAEACTTRVPLTPPVPSSNQNKPVSPSEAAPKLVPFGEISPLAPNW